MASTVLMSTSAGSLTTAMQTQIAPTQTDHSYVLVILDTVAMERTAKISMNVSRTTVAVTSFQRLGSLP